jgi:hypothetical protein
MRHLRAPIRFRPDSHMFTEDCQEVDQLNLSQYYFLKGGESTSERELRSKEAITS